MEKRIGKTKWPQGKELQYIVQTFISQPQIDARDLRDQLLEDKGQGRSMETLNKIREVVQMTTRLLEMKLDPAVAQRRREHWDALAGLAREIVSEADLKARLFWLEDEPSEIGLGGDVLQLLAGRRELFPYLMEHMKEEEPAWGRTMTSLHEMVALLRQAGHVLSVKVKGECARRTGLPAVPPRTRGLPDGVYPAFRETIFEAAFAGKIERAEYSVRGRMLHFGVAGIAQAPEGQEEVLPRCQEAHRALLEEVGGWPEARDLRALCDQAAGTPTLVETLTLVKEKLRHVSLRGMFAGYCRLCAPGVTP